MKKTFCDFCEKQITADNKIDWSTTASTTKQDTNITIQIPESIDICLHCVIDFINRKDNRVK